jgi:hypothetical protein
MAHEAPIVRNIDAPEPQRSAWRGAVRIFTQSYP